MSTGTLVVPKLKVLPLIKFYDIVKSESQDQNEWKQSEFVIRKWRGCTLSMKFMLQVTLKKEASKS